MQWSTSWKICCQCLKCNRNGKTANPKSFTFPCLQKPCLKNLQGTPYPCWTQDASKEETPKVTPHFFFISKMNSRSLHLFAAAKLPRKPFWSQACCSSHFAAIACSSLAANSQFFVSMHSWTNLCPRRKKKGQVIAAYSDGNVWDILWISFSVFPHFEDWNSCSWPKESKPFLQLLKQALHACAIECFSSGSNKKHSSACKELHWNWNCFTFTVFIVFTVFCIPVEGKCASAFPSHATSTPSATQPKPWLRKSKSRDRLRVGKNENLWEIDWFICDQAWPAFVARLCWSDKISFMISYLWIYISLTHC